MGAVVDKGRRLATYLRGRTGSPKWKFQYNHPDTGRGFDAPDGYVLAYMSCKHAGDAVKAAREMRDYEAVSGVLYQSYYTEPEDAVVILPIRHYTTLLAERLDRP